MTDNTLNGTSMIGRVTLSSAPPRTFSWVSYPSSTLRSCLECDLWHFNVFIFELSPFLKISYEYFKNILSLSERLEKTHTLDILCVYSTVCVCVHVFVYAWIVKVSYCEHFLQLVSRSQCQIFSVNYSHRSNTCHTATIYVIFISSWQTLPPIFSSLSFHPSVYSPTCMCVCVYLHTYTHATHTHTQYTQIVNFLG